MIRFTAGAPRGVRPRSSSRAPAPGPTSWGGATTYRFSCPLAQQDGLGARLAGSAVLFAVGTGLVVHVRRRLLRELRRTRRIADAAQSALLRPPPPYVGPLAVAAVQLSADRGARIGGDLYEVAATEHGVRAVIGDVRGHGLGAVRTGAAVLGSFREAVHDEADLAGVLRRLERAMDRHLRERTRDGHPAPGPAHEPAADGPEAEEFVTVLLLEIRPDGEMRALNCGHPWPYRLSGTGVEPLARADPLPPLGPFPLPADLPAVPCGALLPGETLVLHTDGVEDARDSSGRFFPLRGVLAAAVRAQPPPPDDVVRTILAALLHHTSGAPADDVALLVLGHEHPAGSGPPGARAAPSSAVPHARATNPL
ncbi:PP2C family protein-serine/threonine phosphatase [Streptomyces sp. NPDC005931]|uniref:PP2C family protein-serine/threonine phosphatase n=1 Tax=Streptomyces sp. NPDC005931 TaxID=3364737 RepID=UPI0036977EE1